MGGLAWPQGQYRTRAMGVRRKDTALGEVCWGVEIGGEFLTSWGWGRLRRTKRGNYAQQGSSAPPQKQRNPCLRSLHPLVSLRGHWHSRFGGEFCLVCSPLLSSTPPQTSSFSVLCTNHFSTIFPFRLGAGVPSYWVNFGVWQPEPTRLAGVLSSWM